MGGTGSGRRWNSKATTSDFPLLDVRRWQREGLMVAGQVFLDGWWRVSVDAAGDARRRPSHVILFHISRRERYLVPLEWTPCTYGGARVWFLCSTRSCGRRVAILYGSTPACRHCRQLAYLSEQQSKRHRILGRAQGLRMRLGGSMSLADPFPDRPKGMHERTYRRLCLKLEKYEAAFLGGMVPLVVRASSVHLVLK